LNRRLFQADPVLVDKITIMEWTTVETNSGPIILSCDGDWTIREGDWLRLWNSLGVGVAHDVWVGTGGIVYENSGPGGFVRRNWLENVLVGRKVIHIVSRTTADDLPFRVAFAESKLGTLWAGFYNCQDFASEVATGTPQSFQRDAVVGLSIVFGGLMLIASQQQPRPKRPSRR
jgi:hypothetical protein